MPTALPVPTPAVGEKSIVVRTPAELHAWAHAQARRESTDLSKKILALLRQWQADVQAAEAAAQTATAEAKQAEIEAAVAAALQAKKRPAKTKPKPAKESKADHT